MRIQRWWRQLRAKLTPASKPVEPDGNSQSLPEKPADSRPASSKGTPAKARPLTLEQRRQQQVRRQQHQIAAQTLTQLQRLAQIIERSGTPLTPSGGKTLAQLAAQKRTAVPSNGSLLALLLSAQTVELNLELRSYGDAHAALMRQLVKATAQQLPITDLVSTKDTWTNRCEVGFSYASEPVRWQFTEAGLYVSSSFLKTMIPYLEQRARGKFQLLRQTETTRRYLFVSHALGKALNAQVK